MLQDRILKDEPLHQGKRRQLVEIVAAKGIIDESVLNAIGKIPRHFFIPEKGWEYEL
jgi:protein-L-isoaspartate(D-aspartate) O-methyltransferase